MSNKFSYNICGWPKNEFDFSVLHTKQGSTVLQPFQEDDYLHVVQESDEDEIFDDVEGAPAFGSLESDSLQKQKHTVSVLLSVEQVFGENKEKDDDD